MRRHARTRPAALVALVAAALPLAACQSPTEPASACAAPAAASLAPAPGLTPEQAEKVRAALRSATGEDTACVGPDFGFAN